MTSKRDRAIVVSHHIDQPEPCALMTPLGMDAFAVYGLQGPISTVVDGVDIGPGAQRWREAEGVYEENRALVMGRLKKAPEAEIDLAATLEDGGRVHGSVTVTVDDPRALRVQVLLVERGVLYPGKSIVVVNRMVARASLLRDDDGVRLAAKEKTQTFTFDRTLDEITAENVTFLEEYEQENGGLASRLSVAIDPRQVSVVAFVRNGATLEVLQATRLDLGENRISAKGLSHIRSLGNLAWLFLGQTDVGDDAMVELACLKGLLGLVLDGTEVGNRGLGHIGSLKRLISLDLASTAISDAGSVGDRRARANNTTHRCPGEAMPVTFESAVPGPR